jgi:hypothetical protein
MISYSIQCKLYTKETYGKETKVQGSTNKDLIPMWDAVVIDKVGLHINSFHRFQGVKQKIVSNFPFTKEEVRIILVVIRLIKSSK